MKNFLIVLTLMLGVSIFSSCSKEECETCTYAFAWEDAEKTDEAPDGVVPAEAEYCDDELTDHKAKDDNNVTVESVADDVSTTDVDETVHGYTVTMTCAEKE